MSSDLNSLTEKPNQVERLRTFYELVASGQYAAALEMFDNNPDLAGESERVLWAY
jgi:hypothetical protein